MKRLHQEMSRHSRPVKKHTHYTCPEGKAFIEIRGRKYAINVLLDCGSNLCLLNPETTPWLAIPSEARD